MSKIIFDNVKFNTEVTAEEKAQLETIPNVLVVSSSNDARVWRYKC